MNTSVPRMFSSIWNETSVSGNRCSRACPSERRGTRAISGASAGCALPENSFSCRRMTHPPSASPPSNTPSSRDKWLGRKDSNLRIRDPKSRALPLGHAPRGRTLHERLGIALPGLWRADVDATLRRVPRPVRKRVSLHRTRLCGNRRARRSCSARLDGPRQASTGARPAQRLERPGGGRSAPKQAENRRPAARHRRRDRAGLAQCGLEGARSRDGGARPAARDR